MTDDDRRGGWRHRTHEPVARPLDVVTQVPVPTGGPPLSLHLVYTDDGLYVPALLRTPPGDGPHPTVVCVHGGSGGLGVPWLVDFATNRGYLFERLLDAGYAVCVTEGRMEVEDAYDVEPNEGTDPPVPVALDHHDLAATYRYCRERPAVDADRVAFFGASHGGELQLKLASAVEAPPAALVPMEPAVIEYLGLDYDGPRIESNLQFGGDLDDEQIDLDRAIARIERIPPDVPILLGGREDDHLQGLFRKLHELLERAGRDVRWASWDHPDHEFQWGPRRGGESGAGPPGAYGSMAGYAADDVQRDVADRTVAFLDAHV